MRLNGSAISQAERKDAELQYLRVLMGEHTLLQAIVHRSSKFAMPSAHLSLSLLIAVADACLLIFFEKAEQDATCFASCKISLKVLRIYFICLGHLEAAGRQSPQGQALAASNPRMQVLQTRHAHTSHLTCLLAVLSSSICRELAG